MSTVLSDVGKRSLGYAVYLYLSWGTAQMPLGDNKFEQTCNADSFSTVVIERQLRHVNFQADRIEDKLEAFFTAGDLEVHAMPAYRKYAFHGLQLPLRLRTAFVDREVETSAGRRPR